jgi:hypothetical protein
MRRWPKQSMDLGSPAISVPAPNGSIAEGLIRPVSAIGKRYVMTAGMRFQYQTIAVSMNDAA